MTSVSKLWETATIDKRDTWILLFSFEQRIVRNVAQCTIQPVF